MMLLSCMLGGADVKKKIKGRSEAPRRATPCPDQEGEMNQPFVSDLSCTILAPLQIWSDKAGQVHPVGAQGIYCGDDRVISELFLEVTSHDWEPVHHWSAGNRSEYLWLLRTPGQGADPLLCLTRIRTLSPGQVRERTVIANASSEVQLVNLRLRATPDATPMVLVKSGSASVPPFEAPNAEFAWKWRGDNTSAQFSTEAKISYEQGQLTCTWSVEVPPGQNLELGWTLDLADTMAPFRTPDSPKLARPQTARADLDRLLTSSTADLNSLRLADPAHLDQEFIAAGGPWFLTLFGRDSLITALMLARTNPNTALSTLRTLAARQGRTLDTDRAEQPGKILHEVRQESLDLQDGTVLPPHYFGTIDATLLWVILLGRLVEEGMDPAQLTEFAEPLIGALTWLRDYADADADGFLEYFDESGHGLSNQGWKDSGDSIRFADGTLAQGPIVLVEVQGYAFQAARIAATLLPVIGRTPQERNLASFWADYANDMAHRIRRSFWVKDAQGPYLAIALDRNKRPVDGVASNMGHLLGTGVLDAAEEKLVVDRLMDPTMFSGYGVRTMSTTNLAYWPLRYHVGSVWTHDTAMIIDGMWRAGFRSQAKTLAEGLLRAAQGFDNRLPELFGGQPSSQCFPPVPYPASCRPQAWAAASAFVLAEVLAE